MHPTGSPVVVERANRSEPAGGEYLPGRDASSVAKSWNVRSMPKDRVYALNSCIVASRSAAVVTWLIV